MLNIRKQLFETIIPKYAEIVNYFRSCFLFAAGLPVGTAGIIDVQ